VREPAVFEVGQVRELLFLLELQPAEADYCVCRTVEEGRQGGDEEDHKALSFPMTVKAANGHVTEFSQEVADAGEMAAAIELAQGAGKKVTVEQVSCDFTKENFAAKPDLSAPGADDVPEEEFCDNCGRVMVLRNGPWGRS